MSGISGFPLVFPLHVGASGRAVQAPASDEQKVGKPVEVAPRGIADRLAPAERYQGALGAPAHRAREVRGGGGPAAARQDELLERRQGAVPCIELCLERLDLGFLEEGVSRNGKL